MNDQLWTLVSKPLVPPGFCVPWLKTKYSFQRIYVRGCARAKSPSSLFKRGCPPFLGLLSAISQRLCVPQCYLWVKERPRERTPPSHVRAFCNSVEKALCNMLSSYSDSSCNYYVCEIIFLSKQINITGRLQDHTGGKLETEVEFKVLKASINDHFYFKTPL